MTFIETVPEEEATGQVAEIYEEERADKGYVSNYVKVFSQRPQVIYAWQNLNKTIKEAAGDRLYELATIAAARRIRSTYCSLAHGKVFAEKLDGPDLLLAYADGRLDEIDPADLAVMQFAEKVAGDAASVEQADIDRLRDVGLSDAQIFDVAASAAARCFFSKTLDALGAQPDAAWNDFEPALRDALTVGRPIAEH